MPTKPTKHQPATNIFYIQGIHANEHQKERTTHIYAVIQPTSQAVRQAANQPSQHPPFCCAKDEKTGPQSEGIFCVLNNTLLRRLANQNRKRSNQILFWIDSEKKAQGEQKKEKGYGKTQVNLELLIFSKQN